MKTILVIAFVFAASMLGGCAPLIVGGLAGAYVAHEIGKPSYYREVCNPGGKCFREYRR